MMGSVDVVQARIQTATLLSIFEQYQRRSENCPVRLVGAILGSVSSIAGEPAAVVSGHLQFVVEIRHAFPVPHSEFGDQVSINSEYYRSRMELHRKCYGRDSALLGWYSIQQENATLPKNMDAITFSKNGEFIRDSFARETGSTGAPVTFNLAITITKAGKIDYNVLRCDSITARTQPLSGRAAPTIVPCQLTFGMPELYTVDCIAKRLLRGEMENLADGKVLVTLPNPEEYKETQPELLTRLIPLQKYMEDIQNGKRENDPNITNMIKKIFSALGMSASSAEEKNTLSANRASLAETVLNLDDELRRADQLLLSQPYTL